MISRKDVQHIARLARIELTPDEEQKFEKELSAILEFVEKLKELDTTAVEPLTGGTDLASVMRGDEVTADKPKAVSQQKLVEAAPGNREGYVKVKAVFERR